MRDLSLRLVAPESFRGEWDVPGVGRRHFDRHVEGAVHRVAGFDVTSAKPQQFKRFYDFVDAPDGQLIFRASVDEVGPNPNDPSCHIALAAEYRYTIADDRLEFRKEYVRYAVISGDTCKLVQAPAFGEWLVAKRAVGAPPETETREVSSNAGGGAVPPTKFQKQRPRPPPKVDKIPPNKVPDKAANSLGQTKDGPGTKGVPQQVIQNQSQQAP